MSSLRRLLLSKIQSSPSFTEKEYLYFDGTPYLETGIIPNQDTRVVCKFMADSFGATSTLFGARTSSAIGRFLLFLPYVTTSNGNIRSDYGTQAVTSTEKAFANVLYTVEKNGRMTYLRDENENTLITITHNIETFTVNCELTIGILNTNNTKSLPYKGRVYNTQIWQGGTLVRDYVARLDSNGVACAYDKVSETYFYTPVGTFTTD